MRLKGLEPPRLSALDPKSSAATNYATAAGGILITGAKVIIILKLQIVLLKIFYFSISPAILTYKNYEPNTLPNLRQIIRRFLIHKVIQPIGK